MDLSEPKKRRIQNACLRCRQRKGDSGLMPNKICSGCINAGVDCAHNNLNKRRGPKRVPKDAVMKSFEATQAMVSVILAEPDTYVIPEGLDRIRTLIIDISRYAYFLQKELGLRGQQSSSVKADLSSTASTAGPPVSLTSSATSPPTPEAYPNPYFGGHSSEDAHDANIISERLEQLTLGQQSPRHYGPSSNFLLVQTLLDFKQETTGRKQDIHQNLRRPEFWCILPWQEKLQDNTASMLTFPEDDLLHNLIDDYFVHSEPYMPLLHRSTFEKSVAEDLHLRDVGFGQVVLAVCAVASRYGLDPRNMPEGTKSEHSLGWRWYSQISLNMSSFLEVPRLYDLQLCILMMMYLQASSISESSWIILGVAMRLAQAMGLHRRQPDQPRTIRRELWIRAFWVIIIYDTYASMFLGRPRATTMDDFDVELPMDCDQEFWDNATSEGDVLVQSPPNKRSRTTFWIHFIKLMEIAGLTHKLIYPIRRAAQSRVLGVDGVLSNRKAVMELDSALNAWASSVPHHVQWDPKQADPILLLQSAMLYSSYHWVQVHKKFIPGPNQEAVLNGLPSLAICANAARSCIRIAEACRTPHAPPVTLPSVFISAIILLINFWRIKRSNTLLNSGTEMREVCKCFELLKPLEKRFQGAGRMIDILNGIISIGHLDIPLPSMHLTQKWVTKPISFELAGYPSSSSHVGRFINRALITQPPSPYSANDLVLPSLHSSNLTPIPPQSIGPESSSSSYDHANQLGQLPASTATPRSVDDSLSTYSQKSSATNTGVDTSTAANEQFRTETFSTWSPTSTFESNHFGNDIDNEDWSTFMRNIEDLMQSTADFQMFVDES
ncbi:fungal-specific transcription factor domain-containing protein [Lentinula aff. detonsa]|uniref:Fungal-specific transcription factor domain-containing protein n=1 Tax=Lentinula aff. detonsa TaxID=2804958 RepID=A0AA38K828_9AGAR|nr:fungal-specific transcription factor domain-containing protein [Lentinula aff. detonsa]